MVQAVALGFHKKGRRLHTAVTVPAWALVGVSASGSLVLI